MYRKFHNKRNNLLRFYILAISFKTVNHAGNKIAKVYIHVIVSTKYLVISC